MTRSQGIPVCRLMRFTAVLEGASKKQRTRSSSGKSGSAGDVINTLNARDDRDLPPSSHSSSRPGTGFSHRQRVGLTGPRATTTVTAVLCTRLIRKLCDACKVAYTPTPDLLKKLGIPQGKVEALYRSPKPEEVEKPCKECAGLGFKGRTGIFELLEVDDQMREVLLKKPQLELARKVARAAGMRPLQEEGLLLVAKGVTSLAELQRVLKE